MLASVTVGLEEFIDAQGGRSRQVLARAGLQPGLYQQPNRHIPLRFYCNSMHEAACATGNEHFGLWFGNQFQPEGLGLFGYNALSSNTLGSALANMERYFHVFQRSSFLHLSQEDGLCLLEYRLLDGDIMDRRQDAELTLGMLNNVLRRSMGEGWSPVAVHFQHPALTDASPHRDLFGCEVRFGQPRNVLMFSAECLQHAMPDANDMLFNVSLGAMLELSGQAPEQLTLAQQLKSDIIEQLPEGEPRLDAVASRYHRSRRSLQRQLSNEGYSWSSLLEEVREQLAEVYLDYPRLSVSDIAYQLGYSEISAFTRAFVRWKTISPTEWRSRQQ